jgi:hypothetical protein
VVEREEERGSIAQEALGLFLALYLGLVRRANRFVWQPADFHDVLSRNAPVIIAMWHGQHLMIPFVRPKGISRVSALVSRHGDAAAQAAALRRLGITPVRGSGGGPERVRRKGGALALLKLKRELESGASVAMTADLPKRARVAGLGIVTLAKISGRPIVPTAVVTSRRFDFKSWDRASLGKPFGRGAMVLGDLVRVAADADAAALEAARLAVEAGLDDAHRRAYELVGARDPGAGLRPT